VHYCGYQNISICSKEKVRGIKMEKKVDIELGQ
jgi:hypothetical protein